MSKEMKSRKNTRNKGHNSQCVCSLVTPLHSGASIGLPVAYQRLSPARTQILGIWDVPSDLCISCTRSHTCASLAFSTSLWKECVSLCTSVRAIPGTWNQVGCGDAMEYEIRNGAAAGP